MHLPVLAAPTLELLAPKAGDTVVDCTFGAGGHARLLADAIGPTGTLIAMDRDPDALARFELFASDVDCTTRFIRAAFCAGLSSLVEEEIQVDAVLMDLGVSSMQIDTRDRGFAYSYDAPLDMRMDTAQDFDARELVNRWELGELVRVLRSYGEERYAKQIARAIVRARERAPIETTTELVEIVAAAIPAPARFAAGHPAKRTFQALRIAVNDELGEIDGALPMAWDLLAIGGRFAGISFHSLEDRRVKRFLADRARGCICPPDLPVCGCGREPEALLLTRRSITATDDELTDNPRARSARLRAARKLGALA